MANRPSLRQNRNHENAFEELNITPIMNLFIMLIPFLLLSAVFVNIGVIETSLPLVHKSSIEGNDGPQDPRISMTVVINHLGFFVQGKSTVSKEIMSTLPKVLNRILNQGVLVRKKGNGQYNYARFSKLLSIVKESFPKEDALILVPEPYVVYDVVIQTMDASRDKESEDKNEKKRIELFPKAFVAADI